MEKTTKNVKDLSISKLIIEIPLLSQTASINSLSEKEAKKDKTPKKSEKIPLKKGQWTLEEDKLLEYWVRENGPKKWEDCGRFIQGRKGKQCREHWNNCLNPELQKGHWSPEEDFLIMFFYEKCEGSWKNIIPLFSGRSENSIKNRFFSQLRKYALKNEDSENATQLISKKKLHELKNYLNEALTKAKIRMLKKTKMTQEQFIDFINKNKQKIKDKNPDLDLDNDESDLSTAFEVSSIEEESSKKSFIQKIRRIEDKDNKENNFPLKNEELSVDKEKDKELSENKGIDLDENKFNNFYQNLPYNNRNIMNGNYYNDKDNFVQNNETFKNIEYNNSEFSFDYFEVTKSNSLKGIFKDYRFNMNLGINNYEIDFFNHFDKNEFESVFNDKNLEED